MSWRERALAYVDAHHCASLATQGADGPWASTVFYVHEGFDLYFMSAKETRHACNLAQDARVAATINEDYLEWGAIKGVQLEGRATVVESVAERARILGVFLERYPFIKALFGGNGADVLRAAATNQVFRVRPTRLCYLDHEAAPGMRVTLTPGDLEGG